MQGKRHRSNLNFVCSYLTLPAPLIQHAIFFPVHSFTTLSKTCTSLFLYPLLGSIGLQVCFGSSTMLSLSLWFSNIACGQVVRPGTQEKIHS